MSIKPSPMVTGSHVESPDGLTLKERFRRTMFFQEVAQPPNFEFGYWDRTLEVWREQGLPEYVVNEATAYDYFGIESWPAVNTNCSPMPLYKHTVLEENDEHIIYRDEYGCVAEINKHGDRSIPHYLEYPVKDRKSWEPFKAALDPADERRWTAFEESLASIKANHEHDAIGVFAGSVVGIARNLIGFEHIAVLPYEDPELFREIIDTFGNCIVTVLARALPRVQADFAMGWEDICFNMGPIVSPEVFRDVAGPWYRRIANLLTAHGCCVYTTDTDGNINPIVDTFLDNGLTTMFPVEVHGGSDPCALREKYGRRIKLWGGVDKRLVSESKEATDRELERLRPYVEQGGFIPGMDHRVPADVSLENYLHYLDRKRELFNVGGEPKY
ncbi:MAG: hypothetical protein HZB26_21475 [Candidatus Hydrogenedentes bacterium]|nr:hypothetical protein [Candidatus Hydrogenedentota bacterium]